MNSVHNVLCSSGWWARRAEFELIPFGLKGVDAGDDVLEIGPGFGATTRVLVQRFGRVNVLELDARYCRRLRASLGDAVTVTQGDATRLPYEDGRFSSVLCFTMLHHIPSLDLQDRAFSEIARVLRPGGTFAGTDSLGNGLVFKLIHIGDTLNLIDPETLPRRLEAAGMVGPEVKVGGGRFGGRRRRPAESGAAGAGAALGRPGAQLFVLDDPAELRQSLAHVARDAGRGESLREPAAQAGAGDAVGEAELDPRATARNLA